MHRTRFGLIGAGNIAATYAVAFQQCSTLELVAVSDIDLANAKKIANGLNARTYDSYSAMFENEKDLDAVVVATPPNMHDEISCFFLENGISVLCEKPLCTNLFGAVRIAGAAAQSSATFAMATKFRYCADVIAAKDIISSGILGDILQIENAFNSTVDMSGRWNSNPEIAGGGVLIDNGTHSVDIIRYLVGPIAEIFAIDGGNTNGLSVEENVMVMARAESGAVALIDLSWGIEKAKPYFISIYGSKGTLHIGWRESKYKLHCNSEWVVYGKGYDKIEAFAAKLGNFAGAVSGNETLLTNIDDALASVAAIDAAYRSLETGRWQKVRDLAAVDVAEASQYSSDALILG